MQSSMLNIGQQVLHYRIVRFLGSGETGNLYEAVDLQFDRKVVMEQFPWAFAGDERVIGRMRKEAGAVSRLGHPKICQIYSVENDDGRVYAVSEYLEGMRLDDAIAGSPLPNRQIVSYAMDIASALATAHGRGILHRDLTPPNVFVTADGVKLLNFGLGFLIEGAFTDRAANSMMTVAFGGLSPDGSGVQMCTYLSPEQAKGEEIDARSDLFSLGALLYEMATGLPAFTGDSPGERLHAVVLSDPKTPSAVNPRLADGLDSVILKALIKDREQRYQTATEMLSDLRRIEAGLPADVGRVASTSQAVDQKIPKAPYTPSPGPPEDYSAPKEVGRYRIRRKLGLGGFGAVFEAADGDLEEKVAIKLVTGAESAKQALMREFQLLSRFDHPNIVKLLDFGEEEDTRYLVTEYLDGKQLHHCLVDPERFSVGDKVDMVVQILDALGCIHGLHVVHRDVKPDNVMVVGQSTVKLIDFGIATQEGDAAQVAGTPSYMSKEQLTGGEITSATDLYSTAVVLFELLTGNLPFGVPGTNIEILASKVMSLPVPSLKRFLGEPPDAATACVTAFDRLLERAMAKEPEDRFATAGDFAGELKAVRELLTPEASAWFAERYRVVRSRDAAKTAKTVIEFPTRKTLIEFPTSMMGALPNQPPPRQATVAFPEAFKPIGVDAPIVRTAPQFTELLSRSEGAVPMAEAPRRVAYAAPQSATPVSAPAAAPPMSAGPPMPSPPSYAADVAVVNRTLDLALPPVVQVKTPVELIALLRLPSSTSLRELLDLELVKKSEMAVRSRAFGMEFARDGAGRLQAMNVTMRVVAPGFEPARLEKKVRVRPERDAERQSFLLTPTTPGLRKIQFDLLIEDVTVASRTLETEAEAGGETASTIPPKVISVPLIVRVRSRQGLKWFTGVAAGLALLFAIPAIMLMHRTAEPGAVSQRGFTLVPQAATGASSLPGKNYAVLIATDDYEHWPHLNNPVNDAKTIADELQSNYGYTDPAPRLIENAKAKDIIDVLHEFGGKTYGPNDELFFYFAGHGFYDEREREGFLVGEDSQSQKDDSEHASYVNFSRLSKILDNIPAPHIFVVLDVCYGGAFDSRVTQWSAGRGAADDGYADVAPEKFVRRKMALKSRLYLTSGQVTTVPDGKPGQHSPFARRFIEALRGYGGKKQLVTATSVAGQVARLEPEPRFGEFGDSAPGADFLFVPK